MAYGNFVLDKGYKAAAVITKLTFVKFSAEDTVTPATAGTDMIVGVATVGVSASELTRGKRVSVRLMGIADVEAGGSFSTGGLVMSNGSGKAIAATSTNRAVGLALQDGANNTRVAILLNIPAPII